MVRHRREAVFKLFWWFQLWQCSFERMNICKKENEYFTYEQKWLKNKGALYAPHWRATSSEEQSQLANVFLCVLITELKRPLLRNACMRAELPTPVGSGTCVGAHVPHLATQRYDGLCWAESYCLIVELQDAVEEVLPTLRERGISVYLMSDSCSVQGITALSDKISKASDQPLSRDLRANIHIRSTALYIYTSGTTGNNSKLLWNKRWHAK